MDGVPYDVFTEAFLSKITEYDFADMMGEYRTNVIDGYMKRAVWQFGSCKYALRANKDDTLRIFNVSIPEEEIDEIVDIVSEGMLVQWMKPFLYKQEGLENLLSTRDYSAYSPAELLKRIGEAYRRAQRDFVGMVREYSYSHGDLSKLHS